MARVIAIGGMPGTGKTTLMREYMRGKEWKIGKHNKLLAYHYNEEKNIYVLGLYEEDKGYAQGTDRLSMAVQPTAIDFLQKIDAEATIIFEGDRLFTASFLEDVAKNHRILILLLKADNLQERYQLRNSNQSETFLKGRKTKYSHISSNFFLMPYIQERLNENRKDLQKTIDEINKFVESVNYAKI